ncbi:serine hydrolase domain-containing protein [Aquipuribacter hungaricus]|uniref:Serine hydrolase domain-containing protein n=1 Tax=Aquipuribacter hungaricus TaxID=545624 RepID=A0ABV7WFY3_9MICO
MSQDHDHSGSTTGSTAGSTTGSTRTSGSVPAGGTTRTSGRGRRAGVLGATGVLVATVAAGGLWWGSAAAGTDDPAQARLDALVESGFPGVLATATDPDGAERTLTAGTGDVETGDPVPEDGEVRIGSNTKTFTATVVLQLVDEGRVDLDAPVEQYLPGLVRAEGVDASVVTVRHLLQHTSGLPEYTTAVAEDVVALRDSYRSPRDLLDLALQQPVQFAPGERWGYSNTNYLLLGLLVERVTQRTLAEQVTERIVEPLGLERTYFPQPGERELRGEHPRGYHSDPDGGLLDITELDPSWGWAAGAMVSTPGELSEFMLALVDGELLEPETLEQMMTTVPQDDPFSPGSGYGLGLISYPLSCGGEVWGHGGDIHGYQTRGAVSEDGRAWSVAVTALPWAFVDPTDEEALLPLYQEVVDTVDAAFCEQG